MSRATPFSLAAGAALVVAPAPAFDLSPGKPLLHRNFEIALP